jgi:hypothetical protein
MVMGRVVSGRTNTNSEYANAGMIGAGLFVYRLFEAQAQREAAAAGSPDGGGTANFASGPGGPSSEALFWIGILLLLGCGLLLAVDRVHAEWLVRPLQVHHCGQLYQHMAGRDFQAVQSLQGR